MQHTIEDHALPLILRALNWYEMHLRSMIEYGKTHKKRVSREVRAEHRAVLSSIAQTKLALGMKS